MTVRFPATTVSLTGVKETWAELVPLEISTEAGKVTASLGEALRFTVRFEAAGEDKETVMALTCSAAFSFNIDDSAAMLTDTLWTPRRLSI